jgi:hydrogenase maturation protein HypF
VALEWNGVADPRERRPYPFELGRDGAGPAQVDLRPMVRALVADHVQGVPAATLAGRFHETLAAAAVAQVRAALADRSDRTPVVLSGGCFQNPLLVARIRERLRGVARVVLHREVPPGDGGLALGQAVVADALASGGG